MSDSGALAPTGNVRVCVRVHPIHHPLLPPPPLLLLLLLPAWGCELFILPPSSSPTFYSHIDGVDEFWIAISFLSVNGISPFLWPSSPCAVYMSICGSILLLFARLLGINLPKKKLNNAMFWPRIWKSLVGNKDGVSVYERMRKGEKVKRVKNTSL